jgi:papain like protease
MGYKLARLGWLPDPLDHRDLTLKDAGVRARLNRVLPLTSKGVSGNPTSPVGPLHVDLRPWCSPIEDQGNIGSCTAQAVVGALEYFERKTRGHHVEASRLFLYRVTRRYLGWDGRGDTGAFVRSAIKALRLFGVVPEEYWPYKEERFDDEPETFHYAFAQNFKALEYYRVPENTNDLQEVLKAGMPFAFGFSCFTSMFTPETKRTGLIPYPSRLDREEGGHAILAVGYSDSHVLIRNSWGTGWGDEGFGYLPWSYFDSERPLATDAWMLINAAWVPEDEASARIESENIEARNATFLVRAQPVPPPQAPALPTPAEKLAPRMRVTRGVDPLRQLPMRFQQGALRADPGATLSLAQSRLSAALYLTRLKLLDSFDWALFGSATNELYISTMVWDLSGQPPQVFPPLQLTSDALRFYRLEDGQTVPFVGDGLLLWPLQHIRGGLYVRIVVMESDQEVRDVGERMAAIHKSVRESDLTKALGAVGLATGVTAPALAAVAAAADVLTGVIASALQNNGDDLVALFDGTYGAENVVKTRNDRYVQGGAEIDLRFSVKDGGE